MTNEPTKTEMFFSLLRSVYGASKYYQQWPTDLDIQAAHALWKSEIERHTEQELKAAIDNAQRQATNGEPEWQWPNIGLILSGAKRHATAAHKPFAAELPRAILTNDEKRQRIAALREAVGL